MATGGRPTANVQAKTRVKDNKQAQTNMQYATNVGAGMSVNRNAKDRNNTSLADLARQYTREEANSKGNYRQASLRRYATPQTRYNASVRTNDGAIGTIQGVGTTYKKKFVAVQRQPSEGEQPRDSGNGNSPPTIGIGRSLRSRGVFERARAYVNRGK